MRRTAFAAVAIGIVMLLVSTACGSDDDKKSSSGGKDVEIGVILPDTTSSTRYTLYDAPLLKKAFDDAGIKSDIQNAGGSTAKASSIADAMIGEGIKVLVLDSIVATNGASIESKAKNAGVQVIDYDRVNFGGSAEFYVSYDNVKVGKLQANTLLKCLDAKNIAKPEIIEMDGGKDVDNNAVEFARGAGDVFTPKQSAGDIDVVSKTTVKGWNLNVAAPDFTQALTANGGKVDGVLAANDGIANEVITVLKNKGLQVPVTGQDASIQGMQNVLKGDQCVSVFKDVSKEADAASKLAIALINGKEPSSAGLKLQDYKDVKTPSHKIQASLLTPQAITIDNVQDVVDAGALKASEICKGIEDLCQQHGVQ